MDRSVPTFLGRASSRRFKETAPLSLPLLRPPARQTRPTKRRNDCPTTRPTERPSDQATDPPTDYPADRSSRHGPFSPQNPSFSYKEACTRAHTPIPTDKTIRQIRQTDAQTTRRGYQVAAEMGCPLPILPTRLRLIKLVPTKLKKRNKNKK